MDTSQSFPDPDVIHAQLAVIFASKDFDASDRNRRFLTYVIDETLAGRGDRIKAYSIATSVFGRGENFDSQLDSIVRIEAGRLRRSLDQYYLLSGMNDRIRIGIPRGAYVPQFTLVNAEPKPETEAQTAPARVLAPGMGPKIFVFDFECEDGDQIAERFARGFTRQLIVGLTRFAQIMVYGPQTTNILGTDPDMTRLRSELGIHYFFSGSATFSNDRMLVEVMLIDGQTGRYVWAESFDRQCDPSETSSMRDDIAGAIVRALAQPYGVIYSHLAAEADGKTAGEATSLDAVMRFQSYNLTYDTALYLQTREGLEAAIRNDPDYGEAYSCLSRIYVDGVRFGFYREPDTAQQVFVGRAVDLARRAVSLAPNSSQSFLALGLAYWFRGDRAGALRALQTGHDLNPHDTETMVELGMRRCFEMDWDRGVPLLESAYARNPGLPDAHRVSLGLWHYAHARYEAAFFEASRINAPGVIYGQFLLAVSAHRLGRSDEAEEAIRTILTLDPDYGCHIESDLAARGVHPELIRMLADDLRNAGMAAPQGRAVG